MVLLVEVSCENVALEIVGFAVVEARTVGSHGFSLRSRFILVLEARQDRHI